MVRLESTNDLVILVPSISTAVPTGLFIDHGPITYGLTLVPLPDTTQPQAEKSLSWWITMGA